MGTRILDLATQFLISKHVNLPFGGKRETEHCSFLRETVTQPFAVWSSQKTINQQFKIIYMEGRV